MEQNGVTAATLSASVATPYATDDDAPISNEAPIPNTVTQQANVADDIFNGIESIWNSIRPILVDTGVINQPNTTAVNQANAVALAAVQAESQKRTMLIVGAVAVVALVIYLKKR